MKSMKGTISFALLLGLQFFTVVEGSNTSCPTDFNYVHQIPWDLSSCQSRTDHAGHCCETLLLLIVVGMAQHLRDSSVFMFPDYASANACVNEFQQQVTSLMPTVSLYSLMPTAAVSSPISVCLNTSLFVTSPNLCDGIQTKRDWSDLLGTTEIDSSCKGDLSDLTTCNLCSDNTYQVISRLARMKKNVTDMNTLLCSEFAVLYAAAINEFGPKNPSTAFCLFKLGTSLSKTNDKRRRLALISISAGAAVMVVSLSAFLIVCFVRASKKRDAAHRQFVRRNRDLLRGTVRPNTGAVWFSIQEIQAATHNFSQANLIGQGGFGTVYKGTLSDGELVAVKRIRNCSPEGDAGFLNEVEIINNIRHRNLVSLRGCCVASDDMAGHQRFLIYNHMHNGSLHDHLFGGKLSWPQRKNIVLGTAKGLAYLHQGVQPAIYHRDIKPTNILLDDQMNARVSDFGLARIISKEEVGESHLTTSIAGTHGYLAPEYALYGQLTDKSDVYSFGVVVLQIMSGRKALDTSLESAFDFLITDWAWTLVKAGKVIEVIDEMIRHSEPVNIMARFVSVGILCAHIMVAYRPTIAEALKMLEGDVDIPEIPDRLVPMWQ